MYAKKIKYVDFDGQEREETFYFNLTKADIMKMQLEVKGGLTAIIEKIQETKDVPALVALFEDLIKRAYGAKSADGRNFVKNEEVWNDFASTNAYSDLYMELATNADAAADFINNVVPPEYSAENKKALENKADN